MSDVQKQFEQFHDAIRIDYDMSSTLREKRDIVVKKIKRYLSEQKLPAFEVLLQGSYRMKTGVQPIEDLEYDIDIGLRFAIHENDYPASTVRGWVFAAVDDHTMSVEDKGPCVRVNYAKGFHLDLVTYAVWEEWGRDQYRLAHKTDGWRSADPPALLEYIANYRKNFVDTNDNATLTDQFRRCVRYLRRWNDVRMPYEDDNKPTGLAYVLLAIQQGLSKKLFVDGRPDDRAALASLVRTLSSSYGRLQAPKPTPEYENVLARLTDAAMTSLKKDLGSFAEALDEAGREADKVEACKILRKQFGDDFPIPTAEAKSLNDAVAIARFKSTTRPTSGIWQLLTSGQSLALEQLRGIEGAGGGFLKVLRVEEPEREGSCLLVTISIYCADLERTEDGLPLEEREDILLLIHRHFPFAIPSAYVSHERFANFPHVQWMRSLCIYQAPATEWKPSDGIFGFIERLHYWLKQGALGQLDPIGAPLHPPVTYLGKGPFKSVIPRADSPSVSSSPWFGTAQLKAVSESRVDIIGWSPFLDPATPTNVAAAILLPDRFPYEFPTNVADLINALSLRGVSREFLFFNLQFAINRNGEDAPLYVVFGTPMRGVRGREVRQHLTAWYVEPVVAWALKTTFDKFAENHETRAFGEKIDELLKKWAQTAEVNWCIVREERPEIVTRRDYDSPIRWFTNKTVAIWGCGALGGYVAEYLVRAGVKRLLLTDKGIVTPGILVRQPFDDADIGRLKAYSLRERLKRIRPDLEVEVSIDDVLEGPLALSDWKNEAEVIINATASAPVMSSLERQRRKSKAFSVPLIGMMISQNADRGSITVAMPDYTGGEFDVARRMKLEALNREDAMGYVTEFWPSQRHDYFQPEPGCSDPTFVGSAADVGSLAGMMLNLVAIDLSEESRGSAKGHFVSHPNAHLGKDSPAANFKFDADQVSLDIFADYEIRVSKFAWKMLKKYIEVGKREKGEDVETGGLLFGQRDDAIGVFWVTEISSAPPDSICAADKFVCGVEGTHELNEEKKCRTRGSVQYLGMWHTHPDALPLPSPADWKGVRRLVEMAGGVSRSLMLIIGCPHSNTPMLGTYVFRASDFEKANESIEIRPCVMQILDWAEQTE